jgi:hypothetical protein
MAEIITGEGADRIGEQWARNTDLIFEVRYDPRNKKIVFLGTNLLSSALELGMDVEKYVVEKLAQARESLVKKQ